MRNLLHCRRGSAAFATVIALVPLIGAVGLGGEAATWYVTKNHAQNAADAAAYAGAETIACDTNAACAASDGQTYSQRGVQFATRNGFCNTGCAPSGTSQNVAMDRGTWNGTAWTSSASGNYVLATVKQSQPAILTSVLGFSTINIQSQAIAVVNTAAKSSCVLALTGQISFQGSPTVNAPNCGLGSNDTANNAINFTGGGGIDLNVGSISTSGGCSGSLCNQVQTFMPPATNPFSALDTAIAGLTLPNCGSNSTLVAYTAASKCTNNGVTTKGNTADPLAPGIYFISGTLTLKGGSSITGTGVTFILLPGTTIDTRGGGTITISAPTTVPPSSELPPALQSVASLLQYMGIYDASSAAVQFGGNSNINVTGNIYAPKAAVTFQGNPTVSITGSAGCGELIAASIALNGNATLDDSGCPTAEQPINQYVALVQ